MAKMSKAQRIAVLSQHSTSKGAAMVVTARTATAMVRDEFAVYPLHVTPAVAAAGKVRYVYVTRAGLIAAGVDMGAIHGDALQEYGAVMTERLRNAGVAERDMQAAVKWAEARGIGEALQRFGVDMADPPRFPEGTPEYAAYEAELKTELAKFASGQAPYEYPAPYAMGPTSRTARALPIVPNTPAEARTGISDRAAVALADAREALHQSHLSDPIKEDVAWHINNIEAALRGDAQQRRAR